MSQGLKVTSSLKRRKLAAIAKRHAVASLRSVISPEQCASLTIAASISNVWGFLDHRLSQRFLQPLLCWTDRLGGNGDARPAVE